MQPRTIEVNTYNLSDRKFGYRDDPDLNDPDENYVNGELRINRDYINDDYRDNNDDGNERNENDNEPIQVNNPIYYQQPPSQQSRGSPNNDDVFLRQEENQIANRALYGVDEEDDNNQNEQNVMRSQKPKQELYFNTRVRNTGYWGKVKLRRGTWMVIIGLFGICIALTIISVINSTIKIKMSLIKLIVNFIF
jgi:hypothetical protein